MKILIAGSAGQLGREYATKLEGSEHIVIAPDEKDFNIGDRESVCRQIDLTQPDVLINCAAYNLVDAAEKEYETARLVNALGVRNMAAEAKRANIPFVHYGTDYIFDGKKKAPYVETDEPSPLNNYGKTKLEGERFVREECDDFLIFRVSWVFGLGKQNFLYKVRQWAKTNTTLKIVSDEISVPTYTDTIVDCTLEALRKGLRGLYHLTSGGHCSRFELAKHFLSEMNIDVEILPDTMASFVFAAQRPGYSAMSCDKFVKDIGRAMPGWQDEISRFAARLKSLEARRTQ